MPINLDLDIALLSSIMLATIGGYGALMYIMKRVKAR